MCYLVLLFYKFVPQFCRKQLFEFLHTAFRYNDLLQGLAFIKSQFANTRNRIGDCDLLQGFAIPKSPIANTRNRIGDCDLLQGLAFLKSAIANTRNRIGDCDLLQGFAFS